MNIKFKISLDKKARQALAAAAAGIAVLVILYAWIVWLPLSASLAAAGKNLSGINAKINQASQEAQKKHRLDLELVQLNQAATEASQRLPQDKDIPAALVTVGNLADQCEVQMQGFVPQKETSRGFFNELDFSVSISGTYNGIGKFLAALSLQERIFNAADVVYGAPDSDGNIPARFTLIAYQYKG